jgi:hypothetical protein
VSDPILHPILDPILPQKPPNKTEDPEPYSKCSEKGVCPFQKKACALFGHEHEHCTHFQQQQTRTLIQLVIAVVNQAELLHSTCIYERTVPVY